MSSFAGFSEEDLKRIKNESIDASIITDKTAIPEAQNFRKVTKAAVRTQKTYKYKSPLLQNSEDSLDNMQFDNCKLSLQSPVTNNADITNNNNYDNLNNSVTPTKDEDTNGWGLDDVNLEESKDSKIEESGKDTTANIDVNRRTSSDIAPDIVRGVDNYTEDDMMTHKAKLEELQLKQRLMEEQNKKRKEMLAKALADRTKQTAEEVMKLEKIKKELQVLDGQFSQDVAVLRKKIDQACFSYADAEKHYLKVEKEFLQAKINLQKEKEKKELLTEHLCALITHNETRKAQKLDTLMLELASDKKAELQSETMKVNTSVDEVQSTIVDGVDQMTGKMVELNAEP